jgi:hypothetical protein
MVALISRAELASALGVPDVDNGSADLAIAGASAWVEGKTGYAFTARTATIVLPSSLAFEIPVPLKPVREVSAVSIGGVAQTDFALTASGTLFLAYGWRTSYLSESVEMTVEYGTTVTPDDIKTVVAELAGVDYDNRRGVQSEAIDDYRATYFEGVLSAQSRSTLAAYGATVGSVAVGGN